MFITNPYKMYVFHKLKFKQRFRIIGFGINNIKKIIKFDYIFIISKNEKYTSYNFLNNNSTHQ